MQTFLDIASPAQDAKPTTGGGNPLIDPSWLQITPWTSKTKKSKGEIPATGFHGHFPRLQHPRPFKNASKRVLGQGSGSALAGTAGD